MFITATEVTILTNISASAQTITDTGLIEMAEERLNLITNNYFLTDLYLQTGMDFVASAGAVLASITSDGGDFAADGFADDDIAFVLGSYRNDGYYVIDSVSTSVLSLVSGSVVKPELSGQSIMISVTDFPNSLKYTLAQMIKYDYDDRKNTAANLTSRTLGPWSESYNANTGNIYGYPEEITAALAPYTIARVI